MTDVGISDDIIKSERDEVTPGSARLPASSIKIPCPNSGQSSPSAHQFSTGLSWAFVQPRVDPGQTRKLINVERESINYGRGETALGR
jgi:hypothetical protein